MLVSEYFNVVRGMLGFFLAMHWPFYILNFSSQTVYPPLIKMKPSMAFPEVSTRSQF
jgi:hypothetical protein